VRSRLMKVQKKGCVRFVKQDSDHPSVLTERSTGKADFVGSISTEGQKRRIDDKAKTLKRPIRDEDPSDSLCWTGGRNVNP